ncbi:MAG TPA: tetratricopeptide repeat protein [Vicinamibacterales bacterium]|nr:tetratricopeptide repeat protein [Vicinamibacterales bacterium]
MTTPNASRAARLAALRWIAVAIVGATVAAVAPHVLSRVNKAPHAEPLSIGPAVGMPGAPATSTSGLLQRIDDMEARLRAQPDDTGAAVLLADALLRQARATNDGRPAGRASEVLNAALKEHPGQYDVLRMLGAIYLSQHRFRDALEIARRSRDLRPDDAWNYGVMGDAQIELGEYSDAFDAFDRMMALRPNAGAYARVAYARELQGDVKGALAAMQMAAKATAPNDPEAQAWYAAQTGELSLKLHKLDDADREFRRAVFLFPNYPLAMIGQGKVRVARGDREGALAIYLEQLKRTPTLDLAARIGDLYAARGDAAQSKHYYQLAEDLAGPGMVQTEANLALYLADHDRKTSDAVTIAEAVAAKRHDIFTEDALAWAYYKAGRVKDAYAASQRALRTGTRDEALLARADRIRAATARGAARDR